jgi:hypothetical protein
MFLYMDKNNKAPNKHLILIWLLYTATILGVEHFLKGGSDFKELTSRYFIAL